MPFPSGWGRKGQLCYNLTNPFFFVFFPLRNRFTFSPGLGSVAHAFARAPILAFSGFTFTGIVFWLRKMERKRQEGGGGGRDEEGACPWRPKVGLLNARGNVSISFLFLPLVAEPDAHHVFLKGPASRRSRRSFGGGPRLDGEVGFQRTLLWRRDGRALALLL